MKFLPSQLLYLLQDRRARRNIRSLAEFTLFLTVLVAVFSFLFHVIMAHEGRDFSAVTGVYWTLTVMSTLGFGDITFNSDLGRLFSIIVLVSGILFLLVMLPFTFIQFFYAPWLEAQNKSRVPRTLPSEVTRHVLITCWDPIAIALVGRLRQYGHAYVILVPEVQQALDLVDQGFRVLVGELDDATTYERARGTDNRPSGNSVHLSLLSLLSFASNRSASFRNAVRVSICPGVLPIAAIAPRSCCSFTRAAAGSCVINAPVCA